MHSYTSACPFTLCRGVFTPKIVGTFYMQGYKVKEKTAIVPHCTPSFKLHITLILTHNKLRIFQYAFVTNIKGS